MKQERTISVLGVQEETEQRQKEQTMEVDGGDLEIMEQAARIEHRSVDLQPGTRTTAPQRHPQRPRIGNEEFVEMYI